MFVPKSVVEWLTSLQTDLVPSLNQKIAVLEKERDLLGRQLNVAEVNANWLRMRVNTLEYENKALLQKAFSISLPVPEIARQPRTIDHQEVLSFEDVGDEVARKLGLPTYDN